MKNRDRRTTDRGVVWDGWLQGKGKEAVHPIFPGPHSLRPPTKPRPQGHQRGPPMAPQKYKQDTQPGLEGKDRWMGVAGGEVRDRAVHWLDRPSCTNCTLDSLNNAGRPLQGVLPLRGARRLRLLTPTPTPPLKKGPQRGQTAVRTADADTKQERQHPTPPPNPGRKVRVKGRGWRWRRLGHCLCTR